MRKYAFDSGNNLVRGDALTFAYSGSGVATLIDAAGTGYKVAVGTRNLAAIFISGNCEELMLESDAVFAVGDGDQDTTPAEVAARWNAPEPALIDDDLDALDPTTDPALDAEYAPGPYADLDRETLKALCHERGIPFRGNPSAATLIGHITAADAECAGTQTP
jgi:hypothetical protein